MIVVNQLTMLSNYPNVSVALGTFDGVHVGHQQVIGQAVKLARAYSGTSVVFTFSNHPLSIVAPERCPLVLLSEQDKAALIADMGVDILVSIPFTPQFLQLTPEDFIALLAMRLRPLHVVVGPNYTFGYRGLGTPEMLCQAGKTYSFEVQVPDAVTINGRLASSTLIRQLIASGEVEEAATYLGRPFWLTGTVVQGDRRGRTLGYPTANVELNDKMAAPADGVYAVTVESDQNCWYGVANLGCNPTFGTANRRLEVFLFDYRGDLYGKSLRISFYSHLRGEIRFANSDLLIQQIQQDIQNAQRYFALFCL